VTHSISDVFVIFWYGMWEGGYGRVAPSLKCPTNLYLSYCKEYALPKLKNFNHIYTSMQEMEFNLFLLHNSVLFDMFRV